MQQLTFVEPEVLEWRDVPAPKLENNRQALVRPLAVARCDLDVHIVRGTSPIPGPFAFGHEVAGVVAEVGDAVTAVEPGQTVLVPFQISCGTCAQCIRGNTNSCLQVPRCAAFGLGRFGGIDFGGGLSDLIRVPFADAMLVPCPDQLDPAVGAGLADNVSDGYRTVAPALADDPAAPVLVVGGLAQSVGLYAAMAAVALGSERVVYTDWDKVRLDLASRLGAQALPVDYRKEKRHDEFFPITVDASAIPEGLSYALLSTAACGRCTGVSGGNDAGTPLPLRSLYLRGVTYEVSRVHARATLPEVLEHTCSGQLPVESVPIRRVPFAEATDAMFSSEPKIVFVRDQG